MKIVAQNVLIELEDIQSVSEIKESVYSKYFYVTVDDKPILFEAKTMKTDNDRYGNCHLTTLREFIITLMNSSVVAELEEKILEHY